jgi:hypothetical protein
MRAFFSNFSRKILWAKKHTGNVFDCKSKEDGSIPSLACTFIVDLSSLVGRVLD